METQMENYARDLTLHEDEYIVSEEGGYLYIPKRILYEHIQDFKIGDYLNIDFVDEDEILIQYRISDIEDKDLEFVELEYITTIDFS